MNLEGIEEISYQPTPGDKDIPTRINPASLLAITENFYNSVFPPQTPSTQPNQQPNQP